MGYIDIILGLAGLGVLLLMNGIVINNFLSHKNKFTGTLSKFHRDLGAFFLILLCVQMIFPLYIIQVNFLRAEGAADASAVFVERMYLGIFLLVDIISFYISFEVLENMNKMVDMFSFSENKKKSGFKDMKLRDLYFMPKEKKKQPAA